MSLYRCRWQVELLFKELKSHNRLKAFATRHPALAEGLIWASLLSSLVNRRLAKTLVGSECLSMLKAAKKGLSDWRRYWMWWCKGPRPKFGCSWNQPRRI